MESELYQIKKTPLVGAGAIIKDGAGRVLLMLRANKHGLGDGQWGFPGGHVERDETSAQAAKRELMEETSVVALASRQVITLENELKSHTGPVRYVTIFHHITGWSGEPQLMEPEKFHDIGWFDPSDPPEPCTIICHDVCLAISKGLLAGL